jgi:hypothetical protein
VSDRFTLLSSYSDPASAKAALDNAPSEVADFAKARIDALPPSSDITVHVTVDGAATLVHVFCLPTPQKPEHPEAA